MISGLAALFAACVLAGVVYWVQRHRKPIQTRWLIGGFVLPFASVAYLWLIFVLYGICCEAVRGVDLGIGDSWRVPLRNGYELVMIDTQDQAFLVTPSGGQAHHDLTRIATTDRFVVVEDSGHFFLMDVRSRGESSLPTEAEVKDALQKASEPAVELLPPGDFYNEHRWGAADAVAAAAAFVPPLLVFFVFVWRFARFAFAGRVRTA